MKKIYIHGLGQTSKSWDIVFSHLGTSGDNVCSNLAELVHDKEVTYNTLYTAFAMLCNAMEEPISLCSLSFGRVLALNYAIEYPEKVKSLVLIAAQYKMPKKLLKFQNILFRLMPNSMFQEMGFGKKDFLRLCSTMMDLDFSDLLSKISCPSLIICGEKDKVNRGASTELAGILPNAELCILEGAGHEVNVEAPQKLAEILQIFYNRVKND